MKLSMFFAFFFFAICFETFSFCHTPRLHPNPKFVQNSVVANASRTMVPPVWPAEDEVKPIVKQQPKKSNSASAVIEATAANEGAVKSDDGSGSREIVLQQSEPSVPEASDMDAGSPKEMSVKKWVKAFAAAAAAAAAEDESEGDSGALGRYRDISEKRHYEWLATEEGRSFSARGSTTRPGRMREYASQTCSDMNQICLVHRQFFVVHPKSSLVHQNFWDAFKKFWGCLVMKREDYGTL